LVFDWDWSGAEQELKRAIILNPNASDAHLSYSLFLMVMGRSDEAVREARKAVELDPLTPATNDNLAQVLSAARLHDESITQLQKTLQLAPDFGYAYMELGWNYAQKRMYPEAVTDCRKAVSLAPEDGGTVGRCGYVYGLASQRQDALAILERLKKLSTRAYMDPYNVAFVYDGLGENDRTMEWLERAFRERSTNLFVVRVEEWSDRLRFDSRFHGLLRRMNFPQ
jgi:tetratricopeptide (TPR) repeat protein